MSTTTTNYNLIKPELTDAADITAFGANWDILDEKLKDVEITGAASTIKDDDLTPERAVISNGNGKVAVSEVTTEELNYLKGLKQNIQEQLDNMDFEIVLDEGNRVLISDEDKAITTSPVTTTELGYLSGVTSNIQTQLGRKVNKSGDTMSGMITFENNDAYHALHKYRVINNNTYGINVGCGILGGQGIVCLEVRSGNSTTSPILGRLEIGDLGVSYQDAEGNRTYLVQSAISNATVG